MAQPIHDRNKRFVQLARDAIRSCAGVRRSGPADANALRGNTSCWPAIPLVEWSGCQRTQGRRGRVSRPGAPGRQGAGGPHRPNPVEPWWRTAAGFPLAVLWAVLLAARDRTVLMGRPIAFVFEPDH